MNCLRCGEEIVVHWMVETYTQTMEGAMAADNSIKLIGHGVPWPECRCGCRFPRDLPLLSRSDYAKVEDSYLGDYTVGIEEERRDKSCQ